MFLLFAFCLMGKITVYLQAHGNNTAEKENYMMQKGKLPKQYIYTRICRLVYRWMLKQSQEQRHFFCGERRKSGAFGQKCYIDGIMWL